MASAFRPSVALLTAALLVSMPARAFQSPLPDEAIREAYFLGQRNDEATTNLFLTYLKTLPPPKSGPYISEVELYTPYSQLVDFSRIHSVGYSAQQAAKDYHATSDRIFVRIRIFTSTYGAFELYRSGRLLDPPEHNSGTPRPNYYRDFRAGLSQKDHWIEPLSIQIIPTGWQASGHVPFWDFSPAASASPAFFGNGYFSANGPFSGYDYCFIGWFVWLQYDASDVDSDDATVEVLTTDGQHISVPFDLSRLR
jgi:hypothetical protein